MRSLLAVVMLHNIDLYCYADDMQLYEVQPKISEASPVAHEWSAAHT